MAPLGTPPLGDDVSRCGGPRLAIARPARPDAVPWHAREDRPAGPPQAPRPRRPARTRARCVQRFGAVVTGRWPRCPIVNGPPATDGRSRHTPRGWSSAATAWVAATPPAPRRAPGRVDGPTSGARAARRGPSVEVRRGSGPAPVRARGCPGCGEGTHGLPGIARSPRRARRLPVCWCVGRSPAPTEARSTFPVAAPGSSPSPLPRDGELYSGTQEVGVGPDDSGVRGIPLRPGGRDLAVRRASGEMVCRDAPEGVAP